MMTDPVPVIGNETRSDKHIKNAVRIIDIIEEVVGNIKGADEQAHHGKKSREHRLLVAGHGCKLNILFKKNGT
jgi:hypothetical protein